MDAHIVGRRIAKQRKSQGMTQHELASKLSVTNKAISKWETGAGLPDITMLPSLSSALGISVDELLSAPPKDREPQVYVFTNAFKNIRRHIRKSALYFLICVISALTLEVYIAAVDRTEKQLLLLPDAMPIAARITSLDGARFAGLQIVEKTIDGLKSSDYVRDLKMTALIRGTIGEISPDEPRKNAMWNIVGANHLDALESLTHEDITWLPGYDSSMFSGGDMVCIFDLNLMEIFNCSLGDSVSLNMFYYQYEKNGVVEYEPLETVEMRIMGEADLRAAKNVPQIVIPFESTRACFQRRGVSFTADSASFLFKMPLS